MGPQRKEDVLKAIGGLWFPRGISDGVHLLDDAIPDLPIKGFYPSFRWIDPETWKREDLLLLLTDLFLFRCVVTTDQFELVDYFGRIDVRQASRSVEVSAVPVHSIKAWHYTVLEGPRARGSQPERAEKLRVEFDNGGVFGDSLELPFDHDLVGADHNDKEEVMRRVQLLVDALIDVNSSGEPGEEA